MGRHSPIGSSQGFSHGKPGGRTDGDTVGRYSNHSDAHGPNTILQEKLAAALAAKNGVEDPEPDADNS